MSRKQRPELWRDEISRDLVEMPPYAWLLEGNAAERREYWNETAEALLNGRLHEEGSQQLAAALKAFIGGEPAKRAFKLNAGNSGSIRAELALRERARGGQKSQSVLDAEANLAEVVKGVKKSGAVVADARQVKQARTKLKRALGQEKTAIRRLRK